MDPSPDLSTLESQIACLTLGRALSWDVHVARLIFCLKFFDCPDESIYTLLRSFGFVISLEAYMDYIFNHRFVAYTTFPPPIDGVFESKMVPALSGGESVITVESMGGKPVVMRNQYEAFRMREPCYLFEAHSSDGRRIVVELTQGEILIRAIELDSAVV